LLRRNGRARAWFDGCDELLKQLCEKMNGPLLEQLAKIVGASVDDVQIFKQGQNSCGDECVTTAIIDYRWTSSE